MSAGGDVAGEVPQRVVHRGRGEWRGVEDGDRLGGQVGDGRLDLGAGAAGGEEVLDVADLVEARDPKFDLDRTRGFLEVLGPREVMTVDDSAATSRPRRLVGGLLAAATAACRQDMHDQPNISSSRPRRFFEDGAASRPLPDHTVARGQLKDDTLLYTGKVGDDPATASSVRVDAAVMARGRVAYDAFCSHCHGLTGAGDGIVVQRGYTKPPVLYEERLKDVARRTHLRRDHERIRRDARSRRADQGDRSMGDRASIVRALQLSASGTDRRRARGRMSERERS